MKKNLVWIIVALVVVAIGLLVFFAAKKKKDQKQAEADKAANATQAGAALGAANPAMTVIYNNTVQGKEQEESYFAKLPDYKGQVLKLGEINKGVYLIQAAMNKTNKAGLSVDGVFGTNTQNALKAYYGKTEADAATVSKIWKNYSV